MVDMSDIKTTDDLFAAMATGEPIGNDTLTLTYSSGTYTPTGANAELNDFIASDFTSLENYNTWNDLWSSGRWMYYVFAMMFALYIVIMMYFFMS